MSIQTLSARLDKLTPPPVSTVTITGFRAVARDTAPTYGRETFPGSGFRLVPTNPPNAETATEKHQ